VSFLCSDSRDATSSLYLICHDVSYAAASFKGLHITRHEFSFEKGRISYHLELMRDFIEKATIRLPKIKLRRLSMMKPRGRLMLHFIYEDIYQLLWLIAMFLQLRLCGIAAAISRQPPEICFRNIEAALKIFFTVFASRHYAAALPRQDIAECDTRAGVAVRVILLVSRATAFVTPSPLLFAGYQR